jgi:putative ABC transport system ATP-binding protein
MSIVSLRGVSKRYAHVRQGEPVLNRIDLQIEKGEFLAIMGPSGSGKSTLLNLIGGLDRADEGEVFAADTALADMSSAELADWRSRHIGFVFQFYNLLSTLSAERNVELPLLLTSLTKTERKKRVGAVLELVGLADRKSHRPSELSGGQQQRVAIARALVADPTLVLCDEPTGDLDRDNTTQVMNLLTLLHRDQRKSIVMVTHDPRAAEYARRRVYLDKGKVVPAAA